MATSERFQPLEAGEGIEHRNRRVDVHHVPTESRYAELPRASPLRVKLIAVPFADILLIIQFHTLGRIRGPRDDCTHLCKRSSW